MKTAGAAKDNTIVSFDALFSCVKSIVMLALLVKDDRPRKALFLAQDVWEKFPAFFPDFAAQLTDDPSDPRAACWNLAAELSECPGSYDLWRRASDLAAA